MNKLQYSFELHTEKRGLVLYREGDPSDYIYLVRDGEFELTKRKIPKSETQYKFDKLIGPRKSVTDIPDGNVVEKLTKTGSINSKMKSGMNFKKRSTEVIRLGTFTSGSIFGEDDVLFERSRIGTVVCKSSVGTLFKLNIAEFYKKFRYSSETWNTILLGVKHK